MTEPRRMLEGAITVVTGAGSGIGRAAAELFAEQGAAVVVADLTEEAGVATVAAITAAGGEAIFVRTDVSVEADVEAMVRSALSAYGRLDAAFNNAGIAPPVVPTEGLSVDAWDNAVAVNLRGVWLCMKHELKAMLMTGRGSIVNTSSVAGLVGNPGSAAYSAAKHGVVGLTRSTAAEHGRHGIRVNAIAPGLTRTSMVQRLIDEEGMDAAALAAASPLGRMAEPREIAQAALWLASPLSSFVTGHVLAVDGGETAV
jgi:NAD(P)-dependent dehydrogenase (short-subunit alcohol dehydrogenase family)